MRSPAKVRLALVTLFMLFLAMASCNQERSDYALTPSTVLSGDRELQRSQLRTELHQLREQLDRDIERMAKNFHAVKRENLDDWYYADRKLKSNRSKIDKAISDLNLSDDNRWERVRTSTVQIINDTKSSFDQLAFRFQDIITGD